MTPQTPAQRRAAHRCYWLSVIAATATAGNYPRANQYELAVIENLAAQLTTAISNAARLPLDS